MRTQADRDDDLAIGRQLERKDAKIERQRMVLERAKDYMNEQPPNESTANVLAMIHGVLDSDEYVP